MSTSVSSLIGKYDIPAPRYTSYPTVPYWENDPNPQEWMHSVAGALQRPDAAWAAYIHVPFCETLCSFCGCNTSISRNHDIEDPYVTDVLREFDHYRQNVPELDKAPLKEIHFEIWLRYFNESVDNLFTGPRSEDAKNRAKSIALLMQHKIKQMQEGFSAS